MKGITKTIIAITLGLATSSLINAGNLIVGDYNGTADISPSGAATFSIPIECPKGVNGMEPQIKLVYNSQSGIGNAGYGWNLCASSVITKANAVPYYDGKLLPINYDKSGDYIALDGQRLIKYKEISSNEVEFRTENNNYNRIVRYGSNGSYTFKVYTTNGNILTYNQLKEGAGYYNGNLGWYLTNIEDPYTNYITYKYHIETDESKKNISEVNLSSIEYGGNRTKGTAHVCKISIEYKAIADICSLPSNYTYHIDGFKKNHNKAISKISTYSNNILNNEIKLIYQVNELNHHFLQKITLYGNNGDYLKDISLTNKSINKTLKETGNTTKYVSNYSQKDILYKENQTKKNWMATDYDGDGDNDIISFSIVQANQVIGSTIYTHFGSYFQYFKNNNGNFDYDKFYYTENLFSIDAYGGALSCHFTSKQKPNALLPCLACFPKNLKDIRDITQEKIETSPSKTINIVNVNNPSDYYGVILNSEHTEMPPYSCADLNRDGYDDIVIVEKVPYNKNYICKIFWGKSAEKLSDLIGNCQVSTITFTCAGTINKVAISDMNKDGLMDIIAISNSGNSILKNTGYSSGNLCGFSCVGYKEDLLYPKDNLFEFGDFNGDGICDFIRGGATRRLLYLGNSDFSFTMKSFPNIVAANTQTCSFSADIDNDMKTELFIINNKKLYSYKYDGSDFNEWQTATPTLTSKINLIIADFTGDGRTDIVSEAKALLSNETNANKFFLTEISSANDAELLNNITTPLHSYTYSYSPLTDKSIYTKSVTFPESYNFVNLLCPLYVVNGISVDGNKTTYTYSDAVCEVTGKGFLGFLSTKSDNAFSNMTETISNSYKTKPALLYTSSSTLSTKSGAFKKTSYSYSFPYLTGSKAYDQQLVSITESDLLNSTTTKTQYSSYKLNFPTNICVTYGDGSSSSTVLTTNQNTTYNIVLPVKKL